MALTTPHPVVNAAGDEDAVVVASADYPIRVLIRNPAASGQTVYLGPDNVTAAGGSQGYPLAPGEFVGLTLDAKEAVFGVTAAGSVTLDVIVNGGKP